MNKILFLLYSPHYFHKSLANSVGAVDLDILSNKKNYFERILFYLKYALNSSSSDILLCEGTFLIPSLFKLLPFKRFKKTIINISADPTLFYIKIKRINILKRFLYFLAMPQVDLFICVGNMEKDILKEIYPNSKIIVTYPYIKEERYNYLLNLPVKEKFNHNILFIGNGPDYFCKGLDILANTFKIVKKKIQDSELFILGNWDMEIKKKFSYDGIKFIDFTDVCEYIEKSSLYVHLGRGEAFSVSTLEALLGGIPSIVSEYTGAKEVVGNLRRDFVVPLDSKIVAEKIIEYFSLPEDEKIYLSLKAKKLGRRFKKELILSNFIKEWNVYFKL
uniref:Glycosyltransferase family 1 protein n=1 Tax=Dictyoglomus thermophilum TaxID=14 RepID=A0A7C3MI86_DICTH